MKENSHDLRHFHLVFTYFYERYFLTLIPSLGIWGSDMAELCLISCCPFSGSRHLCRGGWLKGGLGKISRGTIRRFQLLLVFPLPF